MNKFNAAKLNLLNTPKVTIVAKDCKRDLATSTIKVTIPDDNVHNRGGLPSKLVLAKDVRVMLTKILDVTDHLVNGAVGTIKQLDIDPQHPLDGTIYVRLDSPNVGRETRKKSPTNLKDCVPIIAITTQFCIGPRGAVKVERLMYPGILAYAITIHKS